MNILTADLSGDDIEREIRIDFLQSSKAGKHKHIGQTTLTLAALKEGTREYAITDKKQKPLGNHALKLTQLDIKQRHTFLEYIFGGCDVGLTVAIDFTLSNGRPDQPSSLHYLDMNKNEYLNAVRSVG